MMWSEMTTAEKIEAIRPYVEKDATASETGRALGCSRNAIIGMWYRYGDILGRVQVTNAKRAKVRLIDTDAFHCRWIDGNPSWDATCCGALRVSETSPYCAEHHARAYVKAPPRKSVRKAPDTGDRRPGVCDRAFYRG